MLPLITSEALLETENNNYYKNKNTIKNINNMSSNLNEKVKSFSKKDNTRIKTESSKDEKNISDEKQYTNMIIEKKETNNSSNEKENIQKENKNLEKNPFFLGNLPTYNKYKSNNIFKNNVNKVLDNESNSCNNEKSQNDDFFQKGPSKSVFCCKRKNKRAVKEGDEKSEYIYKKSKSIKKKLLNIKMQKGKIIKDMGESKKKKIKQRKKK